MAKLGIFAWLLVAAWQLWRVPRVWAFLLLFIVLAPKMAVSAVPGNPTPVRVDDFVIAGVLAWWMLSRVRLRPVLSNVEGPDTAEPTEAPPSPVTFFVLLYWAAALVATAIGIAALTTDALTGVLHFGRILEYGLLYFFFYSTIDPDELDKFVEVFRTTLLVVCGIWIAQHWTHAPVGTPSPWATLYPTFSATYDFGAYLVLATAMMYALWTMDAGSRNVWTIIALIAGAIVIAYSESRASLLALALVFAFDIVFHGRWRTALVAIALAAGAPFVLTSRKMLTLVHGVFAFVTSLDASVITNAFVADRSLALRLRNWSAAVDHWRGRPLLGDGLGGYLHYARQYDMPSSIDGWYVRVLADTGLMGLLVFGLLIAALLWSLLYGVGQETTPRRHAIVYGAALAVVAASVSAILVDVFVSYKIMGVFWMLMGIGTRVAAERVRVGASGLTHLAYPAHPAQPAPPALP